MRGASKRAHTLACTPGAAAQKPAEKQLFRLVKISHNPLVLGSNPSGPSPDLPAVLTRCPLCLSLHQCSAATPTFSTVEPEPRHANAQGEGNPPISGGTEK
jgi:hypothetical protein